MPRALVFKHMAQENLGSLRSVMGDFGFRTKFVNFGRDPGATPTVEKYDVLVVLGGSMGVYEADRFPHVRLECSLIEEALRREIPVLGICLGAQILSHTLGASVERHREVEAGWCEVSSTAAGREDPLFRHLGAGARVFQMHQDTFALPAGAVHLAESVVCASQAFRYGASAYGLQFHLEADRGMIWNLLADETELAAFAGAAAVERIRHDTEAALPRSLELSRKIFTEFFLQSGFVKRARGPTHGKLRD
jgi:GMP synthase (glutamine-hydrolysing)